MIGLRVVTRDHTTQKFPSISQLHQPRVSLVAQSRLSSERDRVVLKSKTKSKKGILVEGLIVALEKVRKEETGGWGQGPKENPFLMLSSLKSRNFERRIGDND